jgi:UDP-2,3-diacylglucosamine pyrophosphatase LpxH
MSNVKVLRFIMRILGFLIFLKGFLIPSFSNFLKQRAKEAVKYISSYEDTVVHYCKTHGYDSVLCGHIHKPESVMIESINYYNTGDWVESNTFIIETVGGDIKLIRYEDIIWSTN